MKLFTFETYMTKRFLEKVKNTEDDPLDDDIDDRFQDWFVMLTEYELSKYTESYGDYCYQKGIEQANKIIQEAYAKAY